MTTTEFCEIDAIFDDFVRVPRSNERGALTTASGLAYGVVVDGALAHSGGVGKADVDHATTPEASSLFRIASLTKSFTAAAILLLRDEGRLRLDDPLCLHVPEAAFAAASTEQVAITLRHLLSMSSGLPVDDPYADRLLDLDDDAFTAIISQPKTFAAPVGRSYVYSNLGYALLGRVVERVSSNAYRDFVTRRLLQPLGLVDTSFAPGEAVRERAVAGYQWRDQRWALEPVLAEGSFSSIGGLWSSVRDLATWMAGFCDAMVERPAGEAEHPLARSSRMEMQLPVTADQTRLEYIGARPEAQHHAYGLGLAVVESTSLGTLVCHNGGLPGYGAHMRWHTETGVGVVALANATYAPVVRPVTAALDALLQRPVRRRRPTIPSQAAEQTCADFEVLLRGWDDGLAGAVFAMNVDLDEPLRERRAQLRGLGLEDRSLVREEPRAWPSGTRAAWYMRDRAGRVRVTATLTWERVPRIQSFSVVAADEPSEPLHAAVDVLIASLHTGTPSDRSAGRPINAMLSDAIAHFIGPFQRCEVIAGDGPTTCTLAVRGEWNSVTVKMRSCPDAASGWSVELCEEPE